MSRALKQQQQQQHALLEYSLQIKLAVPAAAAKRKRRHLAKNGTAQDAIGRAQGFDARLARVVFAPVVVCRGSGLLEY